MRSRQHTPAFRPEELTSDAESAGHEPAMQPPMHGASFGQFARAMREWRGLTVDQVARELRQSVLHVRLEEQSRDGPDSVYWLRRWGEVLGFSVSVDLKAK